MSKTATTKTTVLRRLVSCPFDTLPEEFDRQIIAAMGDLQRAFTIDNVRTGNRIIETADQMRYQEVFVQPGFEIVVERYPFTGGTQEAMVTIHGSERKRRNKRR